MWELIIYAIALIVVVATMPKQPDPVPPSLIEASSIPTAEPGRPIPVVFGECMVQSSNVVWYGDIKYLPIYV